MGFDSDSRDAVALPLMVAKGNALPAQKDLIKRDFDCEVN
jgi:hypothetical protein